MSNNRPIGIIDSAMWTAKGARNILNERAAGINSDIN